jgi:molybdopterin molybdotransferase
MKANPAPSPAAELLPFREARKLVEAEAARLRPSAVETVPLLRSPGRVLAEEVRADRDLPPFPRATRDGYAVRAADLAQLPAELKVIGEIRAGSALDPRLGPIAAGCAAEIMTGAPAPAGADAVVMVEYTSRNGSQVKVERGVAAGENIVPTGSEARRGDVLLARGTRMTPAAIAAAAAAGKAEVQVHLRPRVAILPTGDELVEIAAQPGENQIRNSNSYSLAAQVETAGGEPAQLAIAPDEREPLRRLLEQGLGADLLLVSGGVSAGKHDLVEEVLSGLGAEFLFTGALIQPGRPVVFGRAPRPGETPTLRPLDFARGRLHRAEGWGNPVTPFFGLPGNPVSTMACFELFVRPVLDALSGAAPAPLQFVKARLKSEVKTRTGLTRFLPAVLSGEFEEAEVELVRWSGSGDVGAAARANCYLVVPPDKEKLAAGEMVSILMR